MSVYDQCDNLDEINPHLALWRSENYESDGERAWLRFVKKCERLLGHSLDGNNVADNPDREGYSLDDADAAFGDGLTAEEYVAEVLAEKALLAAARA